jgi:hypothetical protein
MSETGHKQLVQQKRDFWQQRVIDWQKSKLSLKEYCRRHNLSKTRFSYWRRRFNPGPVTVVLIQLPIQDSGLRLAVNNRYQVEINERFSSRTCSICCRSWRADNVWRLVTSQGLPGSWLPDFIGQESRVCRQAG